MTTAAATALAGTRISTAQDFQNVSVWRYAGANGPVFRIAFDNREYGGVHRLIQFAAVTITALAIPLAIWFGVLAQGVGVHWLIGIALFAVLFWFAWHAANNPAKVARVIELDFGNDRLRVLRGDRVEIERPHSRMQNVTVEDHPDAEFSRTARMEKGQKTLKEAEKQHCLVGWFGAGGGEQVVLVTRAEWPNQNSLFEVRQAVLWATAQAEGGEVAEPEPARQSGSGLNPPLD